MKCNLCPHYCEIDEGGYGFCGTRKCKDKKIISESRGQISSLAIDPIEKKPLYHFHPGSNILSAGSYGCNMRCSFCQNHTISQDEPRCAYLTPVELAELSSAAPGNIGVAFTYNEPALSFEYILDTAPLIRANGQRVVLVSNGQINSEPLSRLLPLVDAWNIDIKAFTPEFYKRHGGCLKTAMGTVEAATAVCHVEVTTLIIPGENDGIDEIAALSGWLAGVSRNIPYHLSRFFPRHKMTEKPPTPESTLLRLAEVAKRRLEYVYIGNV